MMLRTIGTGLVALAAVVVVGLGVLFVPANVASASPFPDNNASRGQCENLAWQIANLYERADRADNSRRANQLRNQAENVANTARIIGCNL